ncbi:hypothetical protein Tco_1019826 [Tanacetum coccineum]|uniref:Reverse transcriptase domain-containing protein n=1 Tax=Tanacetum coccineum TaxID=301880 RepID=A0ABQ5FYB8_9ASTR
MAPKKTSTSAAPAMTQAAIRKLVVDSVATALEAQAATMANFDNTNRNNRQGEALVTRKYSYKEFISCQPFNFKALSWWNSFAQPTGIKEAFKITWVEFKKLLIKKHYMRRFQELATLCPTMVPDSKKMMEVFIGGLPRSMKGNVTASKPQTLEEAINIAQRLMDQVIINESLTTEELSTTTTATIITTTTVTPTLTTATIITNHNRTKGKKLSELMLPLQLRIVGMMETSQCVEDVFYITQDLTLLSVIRATRWAI